MSVHSVYATLTLTQSYSPVPSDPVYTVSISESYLIVVDTSIAPTFNNVDPASIPAGTVVGTITGIYNTTMPTVNLAVPGSRGILGDLAFDLTLMRFLGISNFVDTILQNKVGVYFPDPPATEGDFVPSNEFAFFTNNFSEGMTTYLGVLVKDPDQIQTRSMLFKSVAVAEEVSCFAEGTQILCLSRAFREEYVPVEDLRRGDIVKTYIEGYRRIQHIGKGSFRNNPLSNKSCMYVLPRQGAMIADLVVTGQHRILINPWDVTDETSTAPLYDKVLIYAHSSRKLTQICNRQMYTYYNFSLENDGYVERKFAVWANGVLAETTYEAQFNESAMVELVD